MTAPALLFAAASEICARCDGAMVVTEDAIGRKRHRCPRCDGVAEPRPRHPDDARKPQALVPIASPLPPIGPGQLRCQLCACGVPITERFCESCAPRRGAGRHYEPKLCTEPSCGRVFIPSGPRSLYCGTC